MRSMSGPARERLCREKGRGLSLHPSLPSPRKKARIESASESTIAAASSSSSDSFSSDSDSDCKTPAHVATAASGAETKRRVLFSEYCSPPGINSVVMDLIQSKEPCKPPCNPPSNLREAQENCFKSMFMKGVLYDDISYYTQSEYPKDDSNDARQPESGQKIDLIQQMIDSRPRHRISQNLEIEKREREKEEVLSIDNLIEAAWDGGFLDATDLLFALSGFTPGASSLTPRNPGVVFGRIRRLLNKYLMAGGDDNGAYQYYAREKVKREWSPLPISVFKKAVNQTCTISYSKHLGKTPLNVAIEKGHRGMIRFMLEFADVDLADAMGMTPLCVASRRNNLAMVRLLVTKFHANVNTSPKNPVSIAYSNGHNAVGRWLILRGASLRLTHISDRSFNSTIPPKYSCHFCSKVGRCSCFIDIQKVLTQRDGPVLRDHLFELDATMDLIRPPALWVLISEYAVTTIQDDLKQNGGDMHNIHEGCNFV
jgi:hypothetical protein